MASNMIQSLNPLKASFQASGVDYATKQQRLREQLAANQSAMANASPAAKALLQSEAASLQAQIDAAVANGAYEARRRELENSKYTGYDAASDPAYQVYRKRYLTDADRGTADTLGEVAGQTGGYASTAAVAAAQQQGNYYRSQLADKELELGAQDYDKYQREYANKAALLGQYQNAALTANNYAQTLETQYNTYKAGLAEDSAKQLAAMGDFSEMAALYGWSDAQLQAAQAAWLASQAVGSGGSGGSGRSSSSKGKGEKTYDGLTYDQVAQKISPIVANLPAGEVMSVINANRLGLTASQLEVAREIAGSVLKDTTLNQALADSYTKNSAVAKESAAYNASTTAKTAVQSAAASAASAAEAAKNALLNAALGAKKK